MSMAMASTDLHSATSSGSSTGLMGSLFSSLQVPHLVPDNGHQLEYLFEEPGEYAGPSLGSRICYGAGYTYLTFLPIGGLYGLIDGLRNPLGTTPKLRLACVLNSVTAHGPFVGNSAAIIAVMYNGIHGLITKATQQDNLYTALGASSLTGMLFKSTKGPAAMLQASAVFSAFIVGYRLCSEYWSRK